MASVKPLTVAAPPHVHHQPDHHILIFRQGFGDQQRECREADIVDHGLAVAEQPAVAVQEVDKQERADALVAVGEGVILDDEVEKVRGLRLHRRIGGLAEDALIEIAEQSGQTVLALAAEEIAGLAAREQIGLEPCNGGACLVRGRQHASWVAFGLDEQPLVIALQQEEGLRVAGDDIDEPAPLVSGQRLAGRGPAYECERRLQFGSVLLEALAV